MAKATLILNGESTSEVKDFVKDSNVNMDAVVKGVSSKHLETFGISVKENKSDSTVYQSDFDHIYASNLSENDNIKDNSSEILHLKELLLLHLDLIQQQSEQLVTKDKQITALKHENNLLKLRLERMDRRVTLKKHKELSEVLTPNSLASFEVKTEPTTPIIDLNLTEQNEVILSPVGVEDTNHTMCQQRKEDKLSGSGSFCASGARRRNRSLSWTSSANSTETTPAPKINGVKLIKRERHPRRERTRKKKAKKEDKADGNVLMTETPYYTPVGDIDHIWNLDDDVPVIGHVLEVPSWRVKVFTSCYSMEGTENLSDDVFDRRHSRLEIDERRRKRWDVQRLREQRQLEKLRQGGRKRRRGVSDSEEELDSLWPSPEQAEYLQIQDSLPVAAFGCPVPRLNSSDSEFTLPWVSGNDVGRRLHTYAFQKKR